MSFLDSYTFLNTPVTRDPFLKRLTIAVAGAARDVLAESCDTQNHSARVAWANQAIRAPESMAQSMSYAVVTNTTIAAAIEASPGDPDIPDGDLAFVVNGLVNTFAS